MVAMHEVGTYRVLLISGYTPELANAPQGEIAYYRFSRATAVRIGQVPPERVRCGQSVALSTGV